MKRGAPPRRAELERRFFEELQEVRALVRTRHADALDFIAERIGVGSGKTLRVALSRFRQRLEPSARSRLDAIESRVLVLGPPAADYSDEQVGALLDRMIAWRIAGLQIRWRHLKRPEAGARIL